MTDKNNTLETTLNELKECLDKRVEGNRRGKENQEILESISDTAILSGVTVGLYTASVINLII